MTPFSKRCQALFVIIFLSSTLSFGQTKEDRVLRTNLLASTFIVTWGTLFWDYGKRGPSMNSEGWFQENTKEGGADKIGHAYSTYLLASYLGNQYQNWGYSKEQAAFLSSLSSFSLMNLMELGDSFSHYGLAYEDLIMNTLGAVLSYCRTYSPSLAKKLDFRSEYYPWGQKADVFTDYENLKFLLAAKLSGWNFFADTSFKYFEVHLGYFARGYDKNSKYLNKSRYLYVGIGINLSEFFENIQYSNTAAILRYMQLPFASVKWSDTL